mmetsp:Transcript_16239/g.41400  ORF Transcript_16239/g.41400 Transcript_16239/m.41400 type:complete len:262 (-) Transcript_16239:745-1530(-)
MRLRPAALQREDVRVRRQRLELRQGLAQVLVRLGQPAAAVHARGNRARASACAPGGQPAGAARRGPRAPHQGKGGQGPPTQRARRGGAGGGAAHLRHAAQRRAAVRGGPHAARRPDAQGEAQVQHARAALPLHDHRAQRQHRRGAQDQERQVDGGNHQPRLPGRHATHAGAQARARRRRQHARAQAGGGGRRLREAADGAAGAHLAPVPRHQPQGAAQAHALGAAVQHLGRRRRRGLLLLRVARGRRAGAGCDTDRGAVHP